MYKNKYEHCTNIIVNDQLFICSLPWVVNLENKEEVEKNQIIVDKLINAQAEFLHALSPTIESQCSDVSKST